MTQQETLTRAGLRTPRAAAIAGVIFSLLLIVIFWLLRISVPADPLEAGAWLATSSRTVGLAINLVPFAGVAFLWFIGVVRDRLGAAEDRFFATVFLGSALLFLAMLFVSAAVVGSIILAFASEAPETLNSSSFRLARAIAYNIANVYAIKMAGVFMMSTSMVALRTGIAPRWMAFLGFALATVLLFGSHYIAWSVFVLPLWVLLISGHILAENLRGGQAQPDVR